MYLFFHHLINIYLFLTAVDRSQQSSLSDARDAFINVVIDALSAYKLTQSSVTGTGLLAPNSLRLLPLYILALLKNVSFQSHVMIGPSHNECRYLTQSL